MKYCYLLFAKFIVLFTFLFFTAFTGWSQVESEPNNDYVTANFLPINGEVTGSVCPGDVDFIKVILPADGKYRINLVATNAGSGTGFFYFSGYDQRQANGNLFNTTVAYYSNPGDVNKDSVDFYCRAAGDTLYFKLSQNAQCYNYKISYKQFGSPSFNDIEPNNTFSQATSFNINDTARGHIGYVTSGVVTDQYDYFKTVLPNDGKYRIYMEATNTGNGQGIFYVNAYDQRKENGNLYNSTIAYYSNGGDVSRDSADVYCRSAGDTFYFKVSQTYQCFNYKITYKQIGAPSDNDVEPNNTFQEAIPFNINDTVKGHIGYVAGASVTDGIDFYKTVLPNDGKYRIYMEANNTGNGQGLLYVNTYDQRKENGNIYNSTVAYYSSGGDVSRDSFDVYCRSAGDTFYFKVSQTYQCFNYKITYKQIGAPSDNDAEPNNAFEQAIKFNINDTVKGHIGYIAANAVTDAVDFYTTILPADGKYRIYMEATNTGNGQGLLYVSGYDQRKAGGNLFNNAPAYYTNGGDVSKDSVDLFSRAKGDTFYFKVSQTYQCFNYKITYKQIDAPTDNDREPNNTFIEASAFNMGDTIKGHIGYISGGAVTDQFDYYKSVLPVDGVVRVYMEATNTGNGQGILYVSGYDQRRENGNLFNGTAAYYTVGGNVSKDSVDLYCRSAGDTFYFKVSQNSQTFNYKLSYKVLPQVININDKDAEPNNNFLEASYLNANDTAKGHVGYVAGGVSDNNDFIKTHLPSKGTMVVYLQTINTGTGQGLFYITGYDKSKNQVFNRTPVYYGAAGTVTFDTLNIPCQTADDFYFKLQTGGSCFAYKIRYEMTLGADTTVYSCPGCTTDISKLYNLTPFTWVKYTNLASPDSVVNPVSVTGGVYMLTVINGSNECTRDTALITVSSGQKLNFDSIPDKTFGDAPFTVKATSTAGLPVTYKVISGPATISGNTVTITGAGAVTIRAEQAGNSTFNYALAERSFTVNKAVATITLSNLVKVYNGQPIAPTAITNPASLPVTFTYNGQANAPVNAGSYLLIASINMPNYTGQKTDNVIIQKANQSVTFTPTPDKEFSPSPFNVSATATSGLALSYTLATVPANIATINNNTITLNGIGTIIVTAVQNGDLNYLASAAVPDTFVVSKGSQLITFDNIADGNIGDTVLLKATASSSLPVSFSITTTPVSVVAKLSGDTIFLNGTTGSVTVTATQAGNENYTSAQAIKTFKVFGRRQTITFNPLPGKEFGVAPFAVNAVASSGLPVTFNILSGPATISNNVITLTDDGTVVVEASQQGSSTYAAATAVQQSFAVTRKYPDLTVKNVTSTNSDLGPNDTTTVSWKIENVGAMSAATNWTERIYIQSSTGENRTQIKQISFANSDSLTINKLVARNEKVTIPAQMTIGDNAVFVIEVFPGTGAKEAPGAAANNVGIQQTAWSVKKLLTLELSTQQITEGASDGTIAKVSRTGSIAGALTVNLNVSYPSRFKLPATIIIAAGQSAVTFPVTATNNNLIEGTISDTLRLAATNFAGAKAAISILDDDKPTLTITGLAAEAIEGETVTFNINTDLALTQPLIVQLTSNNQPRLPLPATVTIPADAKFVTVNVPLVQNQIPEADLSVTILAAAANHNSASGTIKIKDDDIPGLELVLQTNIISEAAGLYATKATLRRTANSNPSAFTATIFANVSNALILPANVSLAKGENEKTFNVGVIDNTLVDGNRTVTINASIFLNSCGCNVPTTSVGFVSAGLTITDNDGPTLVLTADPLTFPEGLTNAGLLRITRNTAVTNSLTVNLSSSNTGEATIPATATIPAGQTYVEVPITTINDNVTDGNKQVYFQATSAGFPTGSVWVIVTDQNKPDLQIPLVKLTSNSVQALSIFNYTVSVKNSGFATAAAGVKVRGYLSLDNVIDESDSLISADVTTEAIPAGSTKQLVNAVQVPNLPGNFKLLFWVNPDLALSELLTTNNTSEPLAFNIKPDYTATAVVDPLYVLKGSTITIKGNAVHSNATPAPNEKVEVYILTNGIRRTLLVTTDASGNYTTQFMPLANEAGHYTIGASYPGLGATAEQDNFDILGVRINNGEIPQWKVTLKEPLTGTLSIQNLSNTSLTNFTLTPVTLPNGAAITFETIPSIAANATVTIGYTITGNSLSPGNNFEVATFKATAKEGTIQAATVYFYCLAPNAFVEANVTNINVIASQSNGERVIEIKLVNKGKGSTGSININLPQVNWLNTITPKTLTALATGDTAIVALRFLALAEVPFNFPINGNIAISTQNGNNLSIPFTFEKRSETLGSVKVIATDQFTYYSAAAPKIIGAHVIIKNYYSGEIYADGYTDSSGVLLANSIPEGTHRITVEKDHHQPYNGTITTNPGHTVETTAFLNYQAITFNWSVVPTAIQDEYDITLITKFETDVPMPVVTIDMPKSMPQLSGSETYAFNVVLTNHGLITANDVKVSLPTDDAEYEFVTNYIPSDLLAQQSIQIPVIMRRRTHGRPSGRATLTDISRFLGIAPPQHRGMDGANCEGFTSVTYTYRCNIKTGLFEKTGTLFSYTGRRCSGPTPVYTGVPVDVGNVPTSADGGYSDVPCATCGPGGFTGQATTPSQPVDNAKKSCVKCINDAIGAVAGCGGPPAEAVGAASCVLSDFLDHKSLHEYIECIPGVIPSPLGCAKGINDALTSCISATSSSGRAGRGLGTSPLGAAFDKVTANIKIFVDVYQAREDWGKEYFGSLIYSGGFDNLSNVIAPYVVNLDSIRPDAQASILKAVSGYEIQPALINAFFVRWNTSIAARNQGVRVPNAQYPGIINWDVVRGYSDAMLSGSQKAVDQGYKSVYDMYVKEYDNLNVLLEKQSQAVCASVTMQLSQRLTMTREAFAGTLEIFNGHPTDKMDSITVNISITDDNGVPANDKFEIQTKSLTNLANITGTGIIPSQEKGAIKFLFIPEIGAAPTVPKVYNFSGSVRYFDPYVKAIVTMPLSAIPLTVNPSPNLVLHYFMERNILGDDPLTTPDIEPSIPAELAVMVENQGFGPAVNMVISSSQPKIVDNEKGLAINFNLIGSNFQGQPKKLGVTDINFGTVPALQTRIGQWYFTSSLLGKFVSYDAKVVHNNSFGNPDLSLVKSIKLHELTRSIKLYGSLDDGINDFLVNDIFDTHDVPDIIYFSQGNRTAKVYETTAGSFSSPVMPPTFTNTLTVTAAEPGWNYIKLEDPGHRLYTIQSVTRSDGQLIPLDNAWLTFVTLPVSQAPKYENKFHFVDTFATLSPVTYTIVWKPGNVEVPKIDSIIGVPTEITSTQVQNLKVKFNKAIDAATFTYEDLTLTFQGGPNIMNSSVIITKIDSVTFNINLASLTTGNGFYALTVQAANVADVYGVNGLTGKQVSWTQFLNVPVVQAFEGIPASRVAASFKTIQVLFNLPIDVTSITSARFTIKKDGVVQPGTLSIDSVRTDHKLFYLSGLNNILTLSGDYELIVDLPNIKAESGAIGVQQQSVILTLDNTGPVVVTLQKSNEGGLDLQHIPFVNITFNEDAVGFNTASLKLTRNGEVLPITFDQLSNSNLKTWKAGNFGILTYGEGTYTFTIDISTVKDGFGNYGSGTKQLSWVVDRTSQIVITNLNVNPDRGYSNNDGITSEQSMNVTFHLDKDAAVVTVSQVDLTGQKILATVNDVKAGDATVAVVLPTPGNTGIKVEAVGTIGGVGAAQKTLFVDPVPLAARWLFDQNQNLTKPVDTIPVSFSVKLLNNDAFLKQLTLKKNGVALPLTGINFRVLNDTLFEVNGLKQQASAPGSYELTVDVAHLLKYSSGKTGNALTTVYWKVLSTNRAPVANAGVDTTITKIGVVQLNGTGSYDPDADVITYHWVAPEGIVLTDSTSAKPTFNVIAADNGKTYTFLLIVQDGSLLSTAVVNVKVELGNGDLLPVTWLYFKGSQQGRNALLTWATVSELNTRSYIIERSLDGSTFSTIGTVAAAGTSAQTKNYSFTDVDAMSLNTKMIYYRLRQTNVDGSFTYSVIVTLPVKQFAAAEIMVKAYPNPFVQTITLQILNVTSTKQTDHVSLYSIDGKLLYTRKLENAGNSTVLLRDLPNLRSGMYVLKAFIEGKFYNIKMRRQ